MNVRPNARYAEFVYQLGKFSPKSAPWRGVTFRSVELEHASSEQILSGEGSLKYGGRWNAPEAFPVIYSSTRPGTAVEEAFQLAADYELVPDDLKPRLTCGIEWNLSRVIDLPGAICHRGLNYRIGCRRTFRESTKADRKRFVRLSGARRGIPGCGRASVHPRV